MIMDPFLVSVAVLSFTLPTSVLGEVQSLVSSLSSTGRVHTCTNEPLTFLCEVEGQYIQWVYNSDHRTTFFANQRIDTVQAVTGQNIKAILTKNDELQGSSEHNRRLSSALLIDPSQNTDVHNVSCSSNEDIQVQSFCRAQEPTAPKNLKKKYFVQSLHTDSQVLHTLSVGWEGPDNIDSFDLEYYYVQAVLDSGSMINGTTADHAYVFDFDQPVEGSVTIKVTAVSKCAQYSPAKLMVVDTRTSAAELEILQEFEIINAAAPNAVVQSQLTALTGFLVLVHALI